MQEDVLDLQRAGWARRVRWGLESQALLLPQACWPYLRELTHRGLDHERPVQAQCIHRIEHIHCLLLLQLLQQSQQCHEGPSSTHAGTAGQGKVSDQSSLPPTSPASLQAAPAVHQDRPCGPGGPSLHPHQFGKDQQGCGGIRDTVVRPGGELQLLHPPLLLLEVLWGREEQRVGPHPSHPRMPQVKVMPLLSY